MSIRLDTYLTEKQLAGSRTRAQWMIENGMVSVNGKIAAKSSLMIGPNDIVELIQQPEYISYGGYKLEKAAQDLHIDFTGKTVLDIGASTGGFTDYALKHGAAHVTCIDAGNEQLHPSLRQLSTVTFFENTDVRQFSPKELPQGLPDLILADLSFISITKVIDDLVKFCGPDTVLLVLVKPQFEMEQRLHFKNGIVPLKYHQPVLQRIEQNLGTRGFGLQGISPTLADGKNRNIEYFLYLKRLA